MEPGAFPPTRESALIGALSEDPEVRRVSWDRIARAYYPPVYAYVRLRLRYNENDARDLTQAFFERCLEKEIVGAYQKERGRFRTFLRTCVERFAIDRKRMESSQSRGGGAITFDFAEAEAELPAISKADDPEALFEAAWVRRILALSLDALREFCRENGKEEHLAVFERFHLGDDTPPSYETLAAELGVTAITVQNRLAYARRHFRRLTFDVLRELTANDDELKLEARTVLGIDP
jgi:RNA polymerase sigma-70 factor (ECF subfamily)